MEYYTNVYSPETHEAFSLSDQTVTGFKERKKRAALRVKRGDKFICYLTQLSRFVGVLEVMSECYSDDTPRFCEKNDPFVVRFKVRPLVWLSKEKALPIREENLWNTLSFTRELDPNAPKALYTIIFRNSPAKLDRIDGQFLEEALLSKANEDSKNEVADGQYRKFTVIKEANSKKIISVPIDDEGVEAEIKEANQELRESYRIQALLARTGKEMGFKIWIPKRDRSSVLKEWAPGENVLLDKLPLNYNEPTLQTIEQIDVLWLRKKAIFRAFEVEHTTAIYSGILRMADLLALQPNMIIKLHIVAPVKRRSKVLNEIRRPAFSYFEQGPMFEFCTYISYDNLKAISRLEHLGRLSDKILDDYAERSE
ncbi:EVE domain-containing protein [Candidatus Zixiibacteriota bacterium]